MASEEFICEIKKCEHKFDTLKQLVAHMRLRHDYETQCSKTCGLGKCRFVSQTVQTYRKHLSSKHTAAWNNIRKPCTTRDNPVPLELNHENMIVNGDDETIDIYPPQQLPLVQVADVREDLYRLNEGFARSITTYKLKIQEEYMLPYSTTNSIFNDTSVLFQSYQDSFVKIIEERLDHMKEKDSILNDLLRNREIDSSFARASKQTPKQLASHLKYVDPKEIVFERFEGKNDVAHYIPILQTIRNYLEHDDVWASYNRQEDDIVYMNSYADGHLFKRHELFSTEKSAIRIHLYTDEFEICNPIGHHRGTHKLSGFYFFVGNISPKYYSSLDSMHLALLAKWSTIRDFSYAAVLKPLLQDLMLLETQGVTIRIDGQLRTLLGTVVSVSGDNLSSHSLGGFRGCFNSGKCCRHCLASYEEMAKNVCEADCTLRTSASHKDQVQAVLDRENENPNDNEIKNRFGINGETSFASLKYFDAISCFPPDIMHDVLEGMISLDLEIVIKGLVSEKIMSLAIVNKTIKTFPYKNHDKINTHSGVPLDFIQKKKRLQGTAAERLHLLQMFPIMFGHMVPSNNKFWRLLLLCAEVCETILSPSIKIEWMQVLSHHIEEHNTLFKTLSGRGLTPKLHFLLHYPRLCILFGPLKHMWCMRFEANHLYFKRIFEKVKNTKNITKTLSERYQLKRSLLNASTNCLPNGTKTGPQKQISLSAVPEPLRETIRDMLRLPVPDGDVSLVSVPWVTVDCQSIRIEDFVVIDTIGSTEEEIPLFLEIETILGFEKEWFICGRMTFPKTFNSHLRAYELSISDDIVVVSPAKIMSGSLQAYWVASKRCISLKSRLKAY